MSGPKDSFAAVPAIPNCPRPLAPRQTDRSQRATPAAGPTTERQRVRRACLECRAKKVKCNGEDPCARCTSLKIGCEYADMGFRSNIDPNQVDKLEARMVSMEEMFHSMLEKIDAIQRPNPLSGNGGCHQDAAAIQTHESDSHVVEAGSLAAAASQDACNSVQAKGHDTAGATPLVEATTSRMQQLLDAAAEADVIAVEGVASPGPVPGEDDSPPPYQSQCSGSPLAEESAAEHAAAVDDGVSHAADAVKAAHDEDTAAPHGDHPRAYADGFGELDVDFNGQLRYVGLGSTASMVDNCLGLRRHIEKGLKKKGYEPDGDFLASPEATCLDHRPDVQADDTASPASTRAHSDWQAQHHGPAGATAGHKLPPAALVDMLIDIYAQQLAFLFPITTAQAMQQTHQLLRQQESQKCDELDSGSAAAFFALLAVTSPLLPLPGMVGQDAGGDAAAARAVLEELDPQWSSPQLGALFYNEAMHYVNMPLPFRGKQSRLSSRRDLNCRSAQNVVVALGLLSMYLAETGSQADAWITVGRAIRAAQDLGLHRSPVRLRLPKEECTQRRYIWWCLYVLERQLCTALGRPLSIDDQDCDTEVPTEALAQDTAERPAAAAAGDSDVGFFASMIHLHRIIGEILKMVNSVRNADAWNSLLMNDPSHVKEADRHKIQELGMQVCAVNEKLQAWARDSVPDAIKTAKPGSGSQRRNAQKHVALSSFFSAVMLLHRVFMSNPHRPSPLAGSQARRKSAKAATDCIRETAEFVQSVPRSHYLVFHGQYVFVSAVVLLQCIRSSTDDPRFVYAALRDVERAMDVLAQLQTFWRGAKKCRATIEEYLDFTFFVIQGGRRGKCQFECDQHGTAAADPHHGPEPKSRKRSVAKNGGHAQEPKRPRHRHAKGAPDSTGGRPERHSDRRKAASGPPDSLGLRDASAHTAPATPHGKGPGAGHGRDTPASHAASCRNAALPPALGSAPVLSPPEQPPNSVRSSLASSIRTTSTTTDTTAAAASNYDDGGFRFVPPPASVDPHQLHHHYHHHPGMDSALDPCLHASVASDTVPGDTVQFDNSIGNFLGAINPSFHLHDSFFNGLAGLDFAMPETPFFPSGAGNDSDYLQNSFF